MLFICLYLLFWDSLLPMVLAASQVMPSNCNGRSSDVQVYHDYFEPECSSIFHLNGEDCEATDFFNPLHVDEDDLPKDWRKMVNNIGGFCDSYCQIKTTFTYGREQPIDTIFLCRGPGKCELHTDQVLGYSWTQKHPLAPEGYHDQILDVAVSSIFT